MRIDFEDVAECEEQNSEPYKKSDSDLNDEEESSTEDIREVYQKMYEKWLKVCEVNKPLKNKIIEVGDENEMFKGASTNWRDLLKLKDEKIQELKAKLENTQKNLRILNYGTQNLI